MEATPTGGWSDPEQVEWYRARIGVLPARLDGEAALLAELPPSPRRVIDLGCGDGRLGQLVLDARPTVERLVGVDRSEPMLALAHERFADDPRVELRERDLEEPLSDLGDFDLVVSGFAIHHLADPRKRELFVEVVSCLSLGGTFANLEVVASATPEDHAAFLTAIGRATDDPEDRLASVDDQLRWMEAAGLIEVRSPWRWQGFALLVGSRPG